MPSVADRLYAALRAAGMPDVPESFSIARAYQVIPRSILAEIDEFIRVFDRVTTRPAWQDAVTASSPEIARARRPEVCFFSAWDFHLPTERPHDWQLIECNDNGSGMLFAAILNRLHHDLAWVGERPAVEAPVSMTELTPRVAAMIGDQAEASLGAPPRDLVLIVDDAASLAHGKFRHEFVLLRDLCRQAGWSSDLGSPGELSWDHEHLRWRGERVSLVVNRSTDFFWDAEQWAPLRAAYTEGRVAVVPNPFTYATRSDKRLLELLSRPVRDPELGIRPEERAVLSAHVPETRVLRPEDVEELAAHKDDWFFKPCHGFASHGVLTGAAVGHARLRRLLKKGDAYVAQRRAPKARMVTDDGVPLWCDLRVWAYRGERLLLSGRASRTPDLIDLSPPGGWLPTYAAP